MRGKLLEERKKVGLLQRDLQTAQEMLENKDEEHKIHVQLAMHENNLWSITRLQ